MKDRIHKIMVEKGLTISTFAVETGINPATISFILNGRKDKIGNRTFQEPSRNVLTNILDTYPDISSEWLFNGNGPMYKSDKAILTTAQQPGLFSGNAVNTVNDTPEPEYPRENRVKPVENPSKKTVIQEIIPTVNHAKKIDKIMIFYSDNTFDSFSPDK
jgi:transcriptional regulator with XRE-family HTH domain